jgi:hypothetical protein
MLYKITFSERVMERGRGRGKRREQGEMGRNDPNIVCIYE